MTRRLRRLLVWCCVFARTWDRLDGLARFVDTPIDDKSGWFERVPYTAAEIARMCAERADACVAGLDAAGLGGAT